MDFTAYFDRLGLAPPLPATLETLRRVHVAHLGAFPFHNLNIQRRRDVDLTVDAIAGRFLTPGGGGYCFEQNTLLGEALRSLGFAVTTLLGRAGSAGSRSLNHMLLRVDIDGEAWLADVGFGGDGPIEPLPLRDGVSVTQNGLTYLLRREGEHFVLRFQCGDEVSELYEFSGAPHTQGDVEVAHYYTSTHPASVFRKTITIQQVTANERILLRPRSITRYRDGVCTVIEIEPSEVRRHARELFGIELGDEALLFEGGVPVAQ